MTSNFDIIIAGGGMAGATAALGLANLGLSVALVEAVKPDLDISPSFDQRAVALSDSSVVIYQAMGLWQKLSSIACAIKHISVSDQGHFGFTRLNATDYGVEALGQVVALDQAGPILWHAVSAEKNIRIFCPAKVRKVVSTEKCCEVLIQNNAAEPVKLTATLLIGADGTFSDIASQFNLDISREPYAQHAVIANIVTEQPHANRAYERFTSNGPLALLPLNAVSSADNRMSLVWCHKPEQVEQVMSWSDEEFLSELQKAFGYRLGKMVKVGKRVDYPLSLHLAKKSFAQRVLLLGNSAHTVHPIGGQGFNLGLRDIAQLIEQIEQAIISNEDFGSQEFLQQFSQSRQSDWQQTIVATDTLARLFSNQFLPLVFMRNTAMNMVNRLPLIKRHLATAAMGYAGRSSRLARGINQPRKVN